MNVSAKILFLDTEKASSRWYSLPKDADIANRRFVKIARDKQVVQMAIRIDDDVVMARCKISHAFADIQTEKWGRNSESEVVDEVLALISTNVPWECD